MAFLDFFKKKPVSDSGLDLPPMPSDEELNRGMNLPNLSPIENKPMPPVKPAFHEINRPAPIQAAKPIIKPQPIKKVEVSKPKSQDEELLALTGESLDTNKPLFVEMDDYKGVIESIEVIKSNVKEAEEIVKRLNSVKTEKEKEFNGWKKSLDDIQRKLNYIDKKIFEETA